jgi:U6 snRNA-associated Sm-like protein LSm6
MAIRQNISTYLPSPQEYVNGQLKNKYGDAFIRGNNGEVLII